MRARGDTPHNRAGSPPRGWLDRLRSRLGIRRGFHQDGFYYKETSPILLSRALSRTGPGVKEYRVTFPDGAKILIHATHDRMFADVAPCESFGVAAAASPPIRPGSRVLIYPAGTGCLAHRAAQLVGPSGAVVALEPDEESVEYAQRRYAAPNVAHERGGAESLAGEIDGSFDAAWCIGLPFASLPDDLAEVWRVVAPGGWVLAGAARPRRGSPAEHPDLATVAAALTPPPQPEPADAAVVVLHKPEPRADGPNTAPDPDSATGPA